MATKSDITNVVRLPTAASRIVKQRSIRAVRDFREANPWPGEYKLPHVRDREAAARRPGPTDHIKRTPEMLIALSVFAMMDKDRQQTALTIAQLAELVDPEIGGDAVLMMKSIIGTDETLQAGGA